jgi:alkylation response protein AidB-like acyl-CoA dehydrogenase
LFSERTRLPCSRISHSWLDDSALYSGIILSSAFPAILVYAQELVPGKIGLFSEAGTKNVQDFRTRITPDGEAFRVNGKKFYSTGALFAHFIPTTALNEEKKGLLVLIPRDTPGLTVVDDWDGFGQRTIASGSVLLDNVRVESDWIIPAYRAYDRPTLTGPVSQIIQAAN